MTLINKCIFNSKKLLFRLLTKEKYLSLVSGGFIKAYQAGLLKKAFPQHYFVKNLIQEGDHIIDIGANLGYYTIPLSKAAGKNGKVYSIEPVSLFTEILATNLRYSPHKNVEIKNIALGEKDEHDDHLFMGIFVKDGVLRHGLTKVVDQYESCYMRFKTTVKCPDIEFKGLQQLNFIKCDVEGYETHIIPFFDNIINQFKPAIQIEIGEEENYNIIDKVLKAKGYDCFYMKGNQLYHCDRFMLNVGDLYFIHHDSPLKEKKNLFH